MPTEIPSLYRLRSLKKEGHSRGETFLRLTDHVISGGLNQSWIYFAQTPTGPERYVLRVPRPAEERQTTLDALQREYDGIGAARHGVSFRIRTIPEQAAFIDSLQANARKSVDYLDTQADTMLLPFVEGTPLHVVLQDGGGNGEIVDNVINHLVDSHRNGIVFGDRWGPNTIVKPNNDFVEIDYDIELQGSVQDTTAFEFAQFLYHAVHFSGDRREMIIGRITKLFAEDPTLLAAYDPKKLTALLIGHTEYFYDRYVNHGELYEGLRPPYEEVFVLIDDIAARSQEPSHDTTVFETSRIAA